MTKFNNPADQEIKALFEHISYIAVVGLSPKPDRSISGIKIKYTLCQQHLEELEAGLYGYTYLEDQKNPLR